MIASRPFLRRLVTAVALVATTWLAVPIRAASPALSPDPLLVRVTELAHVTKRGELYCEVSNQHPTSSMTYEARLIVRTPEGATTVATFEGAAGPQEGRAFLLSITPSRISGPLTVTLEAVARFDGIEGPVTASASARLLLPF